MCIIRFYYERVPGLRRKEPVLVAAVMDSHTTSQYTYYTYYYYLASPDDRGLEFFWSCSVLANVTVSAALLWWWCGDPFPTLLLRCSSTPRTGLLIL